MTAAELKISNHRFSGIGYKRAVNTGGTITPTAIVVHDTAGRLTEGNSASYLRSASNGGVSVHLVTERDGSIEQQVPFNKRANHAGRSVLDGRSSCNGFTIGIEIVNPGKLTKVSSYMARSWFKQDFDIGEYGIQSVRTKAHGSGMWMDYTEEQIDAVTAQCSALVRKYPTIKQIVPHWYISPGRKVDTNPLFPLDHMRSRVFGREEPMEDDADENAEVVDRPLRVTNTPNDTLNLRRWPSFNPNIVGTIPDKSRVPAIRSGTFDGRVWTKVIYGGVEGWVVDDLLFKV